MSHRHAIDSILKQVKDWPPEDRQALATELLQSMQAVATSAMKSSSGGSSQPRPSLGELIGIANPSGRTFTDEEVDDLRFQALKVKYKL